MPHLKTCPMCKRTVKVHDPYAGLPPAEQRSSAWFDEHKDATGKTCIGSRMTAIDREPRPASEDDPDDIDTELEDAERGELLDLEEILL